MSFTGIVGQQELIARLGNAVCGAPGHAYAFLGPTGSGRRLLARAFAKALLCPNATAAGSCDRCDSCRHFDHGVHPDFIALATEGKDKVIKVERVRRAVSADVAMKPQMSGRKVYLIMADDLNEQGQNALLKTLEEPPAYAVFLLVATGRERLLPTVRSRVVPLAPARLGEEDIAGIIRRAPGGETLSPEQLRFYARYAAGIPGAALDLLSEDWFAPLRGETADFYFSLPRASHADLLTDGYAFFETNRTHVDDMLALLESFIRDELVLHATRSAEAIVNRDFADRFTADLRAGARKGQNPPADRTLKLAAADQAIHQTRKALSFNVSFEISICQLLIVLRRELIHA